MSQPTPQLISASDFIGVVKFTQNIDTNELAGLINKVVENDLRPRLKPTLFTRLTEIYNLSTWASGTAYVSGNEVKLNNRGYKANQSTSAGQSPLTHPAKWDEIEIWSVWRDYLKPYLVWRTFARYLTWAGVSISMAGAVSHRDPVYDQLSDERRARLVNSADADADVLFAKFTKYMDDNNYIIDDVDYKPTDVKPFKIKTRISAI